jgi:hypothetical protein
MQQFQRGLNESFDHQIDNSFSQQKQTRIIYLFWQCNVKTAKLENIFVSDNVDCNFFHFSYH